MCSKSRKRHSWQKSCIHLLQNNLITWDAQIQLQVFTFELDALGSRVSKMLLFLLCASISTYTTLHEAPFSPKRLHPLMASKAAFAIPIELALISGVPSLYFVPLSHIPKSGVRYALST